MPPAAVTAATTPTTPAPAHHYTPMNTRERLWAAMADAVHMPSCEIYSYEDGGPFNEAGVLWSRNYFLYNRAMKRVLFFRAIATSPLGAANACDEDGEDADEEDFVLDEGVAAAHGLVSADGDNDEEEGRSAAAAPLAARHRSRRYHHPRVDSPGADARGDWHDGSGNDDAGDKNHDTTTGDGGSSSTNNNNNDKSNNNDDGRTGSKRQPSDNVGTRSAGAAAAAPSAAASPLIFDLT